MLSSFPQPELRVSDRTAPWRSWLEGCAELSALSDALASADPVQDQQLLAVAAQQPSQPRAGERCSDGDCAARKSPDELRHWRDRKPCPQKVVAAEVVADHGFKFGEFIGVRIGRTPLHPSES
jgi:hypothetical protein